MSLTDAIKGLLSNMAGAFEPGKDIYCLRKLPYLLYFLFFIETIEYVYNVDYIQSHKIDLAICDHFCSPCVEAALLHKIPFIITGTFPYSPGKKQEYEKRLIYSFNFR